MHDSGFWRLDEFEPKICEVLVIVMSWKMDPIMIDYVKEEIEWLLGVGFIRPTK